jgi:hypothetical protein
MDRCVECVAASTPTHVTIAVCRVVRRPIGVGIVRPSSRATGAVENKLPGSKCRMNRAAEMADDEAPDRARMIDADEFRHPRPALVRGAHGDDLAVHRAECFAAAAAFGEERLRTSRLACKPRSGSLQRPSAACTVSGGVGQGAHPGGFRGEALSRTADRGLDAVRFAGSRRPHHPAGIAAWRSRPGPDVGARAACRSLMSKRIDVAWAA